MNESYYDSIQRVFTKGLLARDIAEPLVSFDAGTPAATALAVMQARDYDAVGVRREGLVVGYAVAEEMGDGLCGDHVHPLADGVVLPDTAPIPDLVRALHREPQVFIKVLGAVGGIVTRADMQDPPVRMWLFGLVTLIELRLLGSIERRFPDGGWERYLSASRLEKAQALQDERSRRGQSPRLLDCLQFSDKGQIVVRDEQLRRQVGFPSRRRGEEVIKRLEALRNNLAHSQDIVALDWESILVLAENLDDVLERLSRTVGAPWSAAT